jgi:hypothetical protein
MNSHKAGGVKITQHRPRIQGRWSTRHAAAKAHRVRLAALRSELSSYTSPSDLDELDALLKRASQTPVSADDVQGMQQIDDLIAVVNELRVSAAR